MPDQNINKNKAENKPKFSLYFYNPVSYAGFILAIFTFVLEVILFGVEIFAHGQNLYLGMFTYVLIPPFLILGLALIPIGALIKKRRVLKGISALEPKTLRIDPSNPQHRNAILVFSLGTLILFVMTAIGVYKGFHYTESVQFCGTLCHEVMKPEHTAYLKSPHGKVKCVECHIGAGADWYVRSKMSGARQVLRTMTNSYARPVKTPVHNLRPAEETCKQCHWPGKFFGSFDFKRSYYLTENQEKPWNIRMLVKVGGGDHQAYGVHAHMSVDHEIYYAAEDEKRQKITWVKSVDKNGQETLYVSPGSKWKDAAPDASQIRRMDCIDCHNRPTHQFTPPYRLLNDALQFKDLDADMPGIKEKGMELLSGKYATESEAFEKIEQGLKNYYQTKHPDYFKDNADKIQNAVGVIQKLFSQNMFPEMKTRWDTHADNIGHLHSQGCFRCHGGEHKSLDGKIITRDCKTCHVIVEQGFAGETEKNLDGLDFKHPSDIGDDWKDSSCTDCHSGGA